MKRKEDKVVIEILENIKDLSLNNPSDMVFGLINAIREDKENLTSFFGYINWHRLDVDYIYRQLLQKIDSQKEENIHIKRK